MMRFFNISEAMTIALHTCIVLALEEGRQCSVRETAEKVGASANHSAKVVRELARAGIVNTERGPAGGVTLARPATKITILDILEAVGGASDSRACLLRTNVCKGGCCMLGKFLAEQNRRLNIIAKRTSLASIVRSLNPGAKGDKK